MDDITLLKPKLRFAPLIAAVQLLILFIPYWTADGYALLPREVVVIANSSIKASLELAKRYIRARNLPRENLFQVNLSTAETIERQEYDSHLVKPLRQYLRNLKHGSRIRCLLVMYGIPLKVAAPKLTEAEVERLEQLRLAITKLRLQLTKIKYKAGAAEKEYKARLDKLIVEKAHLEPLFRRAAVDSELMLVMVDTYPLEGWQANPFFVGFQNKKGLADKDKVMMVSRLDGPNPETVVRILADTFAVEKTGLKGRAYFDARWSQTNSSDAKGYQFYDQALHQAARDLRESRKMSVTLNKDETLFDPGCCPDAALYCGWYSLANYVPAFTWQRGAIGYHIASAECSTLRESGSQVWCKRMIEEGVAATLGPVDEPYVQSFPPPNLFFHFLVEGKLTLAECYLLSLPYLSWKMVLIGDPLYRPFAAFDQTD